MAVEHPELLSDLAGSSMMVTMIFKRSSNEAAPFAFEGDEYPCPGAKILHPAFSYGIPARRPARIQASSPARKGVVVLPGLGNNKKDYDAIAADLEEQGLVVNVAEVTRIDWLRNAAGLVDINYWKGTLNPRPTVDWYLKKVETSVAAVKERTADGSPVTLLAHSAGGWLARVFLLGYGTADIDRLITIGSPHLPPPEAPFVIDQTRGILKYVEDNCPGNFHQEVDYVTIAGKFIKGAKLGDKTASNAQKIAGAGYKQVCGDPEAWGDGIVPLDSAHLNGARQITLEGVYHSPVGAVHVLEDGQPGRQWYGSRKVLKSWIGFVTCPRSELKTATVKVEDVLDQVAG